ncbi:Ger(x)C family spore germination protein [Paenibacillus sacheonensis]|uniref:Ger(X)C family spore germination protein n=1 Tax=Paenibacillus sacheonensis TaxID=742054 RepID=A0A7X4YUS1_9BACL|nr:Ger(x)C family spore germination protein [Paenibacillus sacheonensis]MBM7568164.1 spore germination protein [Paenibacillus sacheonensis]NBC71834.1 Ger(x)C family spore germination protein [Paenibacillus sacheonensis]
MKRAFIVVYLLCVLLTGCVKQEILEKSTISFVGAFDEAADDQIEMTLAPPRFHSGKSISVSNNLISNIGHTSKSIVQIMDMKLNRTIKTGKISVVLFEKAMAQKGLADELDVFLRDALSSRKLFVAVVDGKAKNLLHADFSSDVEKGMYLFDLLQSNVRTGFVPRQNLNDFEYAYLGKGMDPFLPILALRNGHVVISGLALFKDDRYVSSLNEQQMRMVKLLRERTKHGTLEARLDNGTYAAVRNVGSNVKYRVSRDQNRPKVAIALRFKGEVMDTQGFQLTRDEKQRIKEALEKELAATGTALIQQFKNEGIDPLGLGDIVRSKTRNWNEAAWKKQYPAVNVSLKVHVDILDSGIRK